MKKQLYLIPILFLFVTNLRITAQTGAALNFDGVDDYVKRSETNFSTGDFCIELWARPTSFSQEAYLVSNRTSEFSGPGYWYELGIVQSSGLLEFNMGAANLTGGFSFYSPAALTLNVWQHLAITRTGNLFGLYVNGILVSSGSDIGTRDLTSQSGNNTVTFGAWGPPLNQRFFKGDMDEVRIWNASRSQCQIQSNMRCEIPTTATNLIGNYHFNQGTASGANTGVSSLTDVSASASNGIFNNFGLIGGISNFITPGGVTSGSTTAVSITSSITVTGSVTAIVNGATTTNTTNLTDFNGASTRTFVISNSGTGTLNIGTPFFTGANASEFSVTTIPSGSLTTGTTSLVIAFTPTSTGTKSATVNFFNNDCGKPIFNFVISDAAAGAALSLDGTNDYLSRPVITTQNNNITMQARVYLSAATATNQVIIYNGNSSTSGYGFFATSARQIQILYGGNTTYSTGYFLPLSQWTALTLVIETGGTIRFYADGLQVYSTSAGLSAVPSGSFLIGADNLGTETLNGSVDEVLFWKRALSQCEIQTNLSSEIPTTASSLTANYHFNQGIAVGNNIAVTTATDASGNGNNLTLNNFALTGATSNWITPGAVVSGYTVTTPISSTIAVTGNGNPVLNGSTGTSVLNNTNFNGVAQQTFVVANTGGNLYINNITFSGLNASDFSVTSTQSFSLGNSNSNILTIAYNPTVAGTSTAIVEIKSSNCAVADYSFVITASVAPGSALSFDGTSDFVEAANNSAIMLSSALSLEAWVKPNTIAGTQYIVSKGTNDLANGQYGIVIINGVAQFHMYNSGHVGILANYTLTAGVWTHLAATWDGANMKLYVNGILNNSGTYSTPLPANTGSLEIGRLSAGGYWFNGSMDELRIWNTARTQCDILTYMNAETTSTLAGLVANYHFNQGIASGQNTSVTTLIDASVNNNTGTLNTFNLTAGNSTSNWVSPGGVPNNYTTTLASSASLAVTGNGNAVNNGATSTSTNNFTDFTAISSRTFVTMNAVAGSSLYISSITLSGGNASDFSVTSTPSPTLALTTGTSGSFMIAFNPLAIGTRSAIVTINSSDCANPNYSFVISASVSAASALSFDGSNDYIQRADYILGTGDLTLEAWIRPADLTTIQHLVHNRTNEIGAVGNWFYMGISNSGQLTYEMADSGTSAYYTSTSPLSLNTWQHLAAVRSGLQVTLYVNGISQGSFTDSFARNLTNVSNTGQIGGNHNSLSAWFNGTMDEVRVWNVARTQCEILTYMNAEIPNSASGLIANYHFNEGVPSGSNAGVTSLTDATGIDNGTLTNFSLSGNISNWVSPGGVINNYTTVSAPGASLLITANSNTIINGSLSTYTADFTDFGTASTRVFSLQTSGSGNLYINSVTLIGANATDFSVTTMPPSSLTAGNGGTFAVTFVPSATGVRTTQVIVNSSDCSVSDYSFVITSSVSAASALGFDGASTYIEVPVINFSGSDKMTIEGWIKPTDITTNTSYAICRQDGGTDWVFEFQNNGSRLSFGLSTTSSGYSQLDATITPAYFTDGSWHHVAAVYDGAYQRIYVDGLQIAVTTRTGNVTFTGTHQNIGKSPVGLSFFNGYIDELRYWSTGRTQCEIQTYMNCEVPPATPGLVTNYHFNQGIPSGPNTTVDTLIDAVGAATGTLVNFALTGSVTNWVSPGGIVNDYTVTNIQQQEINLIGNAANINDGATSTSTINSTDFGVTCINVALTKTFTVQNTGTGMLQVSSYTVVGADAGLFSLTATPSTIAASSSATFAVTFSPTSSGTKNATINIFSNDCDEALYDFAITGSVNPTPTVSVANGTICSGSTFTLSPSGASTYTYSSGSATVTPIITTVYSVTGTSSLGCVDPSTATATITVNSLPGVSISASTQTVCSGSPVTLTVSGAATYTWNNTATTSSILISPTVSTTYSVTGTDNNGCAGTAFLLITANPLPTITVNSGAICPGNSFTITPGGASTYTYLTGSAVVTPTSGINTYSITGTSSLNCDASYPAIATVSVVNTVTVAVSGNTVICDGQSATLTASGATTYSWTNGVQTDTVVLTPATLTSYTVYGMSGACSNSAAVTVSVNSTPTINVNSGAICAGNSFTLNPTGAGTYTFSGGSAVVSPANTTTYGVTGTGTNNCVSSNTAISNITVNALPVLTLAGTQSVCDGAAASLTVSGASTYTWSNSSTGNILSVIPSGNTTYTVNGTDINNCIGSASQLITVSPLPTITISNGAVCPGNSYTLNPSGAVTYTYSNGSNVVSPSATTSYSITGADASGCISATAAVVTVSVINTVTVSVTGNTTICDGQTTTLTASGATTYSWNNGATTGTIALAPATTTDYTVYGASGNCSNSEVVSVSVNPTPSISVNGGTVCSGSAFTLNPSGAVSYTYSGGSAVVNPGSSTSYSITGEDANGCISANPAVASITVSALPTLTTTASSSAVCAGNTISLTASGAATYSWSDGQTSATAAESPTVTSTYTVTGTDANGCQDTATIAASVYTVATIHTNIADTVICLGDSLIPTVSGSGTYTYSWSGGLTMNVIFIPTATSVYTLTGTDQNGCEATAIASVSVNTIPTLTIVSSRSTVCEGDSVTLTASGATTYSWLSGSSASPVITVAPTLTHNSYTVEGLTTGSCNSTTVFTITVKKCVTDSALIMKNGITPNGDNVNDRLTIENINRYEFNRVTIFNRWGVTVADIPGYNNIDRSWPTPAQADKLTAGTYFYLIDPGNGFKIVKGWVEVMKD